jgi:hypothetical protein
VRAHQRGEQRARRDHVRETARHAHTLTPLCMRGSD